MKVYATLAERVRKVRKNNNREFRQIARLIQQGRIKKAYQAVCALDEGLREEIPQSVWNYLYKSVEGVSYPR